MKLSIIIPAYNELNTILEVIRRVQKERHEKEIIIVDDGSTDGTTDLLQQVKSENIKILFNNTNKGKGYAIRAAIKYITGDIVIIQDADLEYYPDEYDILIEKIIQGKADVVYGSRFLGAHRVFYFYHYLGNLVLNFIANFLLNTNLTDLMTGYKVFKASVLRKLVLQANGFGIETEITAEVFKRRFRVYEVPITYEGRGYEEGKKIRWVNFFTCIYWLIKACLRSIDIGTEILLRMRMMKNNNAWSYNKISPFLGQNVLEIGSGIGTFSSYLVSQKRNIILTDINDEYIDYLRNRFIGNPRVKVIKMDISNMGDELQNEKIDSIVGINVLEHIQDDSQLLAEFKNRLNENGRLLLIVPAHRVLYGTLDKRLQHYRRYSKAELTTKLKNAGFLIEKLEYMNFLSGIGWFINYKILMRKHMSIMAIHLADKLIPLVDLIEKYIKFPFGLSLFTVAKLQKSISHSK